MRILYIIGNGFDKAQDLKTSYKEFEAYYKSLPSDNDVITSFKQDIDPNIELWADLEMALGQYTEQISETKDFEEIYFDVQEKLEEYLRIQESQFQPKDIDKYYDDALHPEIFLEPADAELFHNYMINSSNGLTDERVIDVISFNYTNCFEKALGIEKSGKHSNPLMTEIVHIHGALDENNPIILGVDSVSQVSNKSYNHSGVEAFLIKPRSNDAIRSNNPARAQRLIERADVIVLFGVSIGESDITWWKMIADEMLKRHNLMVVVHKYVNAELDYRRKAQWMSMFTGIVKSTFQKRAFVDRNGYLENKGVVDLIHKNVVVAINKPLFKGDS